MFGGYITSVSTSGDEIEIICRDRLMDLERVPYKNFTLGGVKSPQEYTAFTSFLMFMNWYDTYPSMQIPFEAHLVPYDFAVNLTLTVLMSTTVLLLVCG